MSSVIINSYGFGAAPGSPFLDAATGLTGAWSAGRKMVSAYGGAFYTDVSGNASEFLDQSGNSRNFTRTTAAARPLITTAGNQSRACLDFRPQSVDGTNDSMENVALSNFISATDGYLALSVILDDANRTSFTTTNIHLNDSLILDASSKFGVVTSASNLCGFNNDGSFDINTHAVSNSTHYVFELWHTGGNVKSRVNGGATTTTASGNTNSLTGLLRLGALSNQVDFKLFELFFCSTVPTGTEMDAYVAAMQAWAA